MTTENIQEAEVVEIEKTPEQAIQEALANENVRANAVATAKEINEEFRGKTFTIDQAQKKCGFKNAAECFDVLNLLCLFELAYRVVKGKNIVKYKICLTPKDKLDSMIGQLAELNAERDELVERIKEFKTKNNL